MKEAQVAHVAKCANTVAAWLGRRDLHQLDRHALRTEAGLPSGTADLFVLFGGGVLGTIETLASAMREGVARRYAIVGGRGRATDGLVSSFEHIVPELGGELADGPLPDPAVASEAEMLAAVLRHRHGLAPDVLETHSTNCGNNIEYLLDILDGWQQQPQSVVLSQDAAMQLRMDATWRRQVCDRVRYAHTKVINWAAYAVELTCESGTLAYAHAPEGMWDTHRYLELLAGDVSRLTDDDNGYGPRGTDFVAHVDVPTKVRDAARELERYLSASAAHEREA